MNVLVTGGCGFIGSNLSCSFLRNGDQVTILDALLRPGSEINLDWLRQQATDGRLQFLKGDVRDADMVRAVARDADVIFHVAGQVAVTTSVERPREDFEVNALGTFNVLEAARLSERRPIVIFTSTNKVYGGLDNVKVVQNKTRYRFARLPRGIAESQPLDFHSPYGCSKGTGDQYVRDYARIFGLRTVVFRMSCIYGPRQFGNEDQGWVAHFMIAALTGGPLTIYGDGKQVRDLLFIDDLVRAFRLAVQHIDRTSGQVFNIGGGPENTLAVWSEFSQLIAELKGEPVPVSFEGWRPGDQPCYVSDIRKAASYMGWRPRVAVHDGAKRLWNWLRENRQMLPTQRVERARGAGGGQSA